ncbi:hypothetical protein PHYBLDRAFT_73222 [Phycomyces blakesleeanus NRRL 1555(-)]|uniref:Uncharacterized protein n=1 Tax=Phycomyces blakesleeanus (strain ATCC 8743b / DSM 1359 / FGSC 10004 / NBRC 33097 / NRRL 1555) TaxID=763407 RepID=A0A167JGR7_PHYB8|nr:hypothetical protein PHYBLDRAFT_73222 [Phycomyces blakesleeanus NRRL 1555(-)]OAD65939.1 hypothetical protein PHYBLDRAFT_73222 [Phycomyces blakesleeanus NRRL 1555(-)]|eukprot:XP_018283979.1 hypothetical protein PHYBLDRAFT_73222 [Phycomyces blakesleeanus NRRL 1555(-)]
MVFCIYVNVIICLYLSISVSVSVLFHYTLSVSLEDTIILFISDAFSSQCLFQLANVNERPFLKYSLHLKLSSHATVIDMTILALDKDYQDLQIQLFALVIFIVKVVILGAMSNIPDILLIFSLVSDVFNASSSKLHITGFFERNNICVTLLNSNSMKDDKESGPKYIIVSLDVLYNHFITLVDKKVVADLDSNSHQLLSCAFGKIVEGPVSDAIASQFPQWDLRNGS